MTDQRKPLLEPTSNGEWKLLCPFCGFNCTHHSYVEIFDRDHEDGPSRVLSSRDNAPWWKPSGPNNRNPSSRRDGLTIHFWGECGHEWELDIYQHKGETFFRPEIKEKR
jgi:hypothetical protein